ncbi:unnamed protein product [Cochlearia groenlandica]
MGTCFSVMGKSRYRPLKKKDDHLLTVANSPEMVEENGGDAGQLSVASSSSNKIISESPVTETLTPAATPTATMINGVTQVKPRWSFSSSKKSNGSSKDETFFESYQWLQSDSEDDFHSVKGEFTPSPSYGNTPKCSLTEKVPRFQNPLFEEEKRRVTFAVSPKPRRKKLGELFRDSIREEEERGHDHDHDDVILEESLDNTIQSHEESTKKKNVKSSDYHHRCLPRFSLWTRGRRRGGGRRRKIIW